jgi:hypothetical protein
MYGLYKNRQLLIESRFTRVDVEGSRITYYFGDMRHRFDRDARGLTLPSVEEWYNTGNRDIFWYSYGILHRDERDPETKLTLPACIYSYGTIQWVKNNKIRNDDRDEFGCLLPAITNSSGEKFYIMDGQYVDKNY